MWKRKLSEATAAAVLLSACFGCLPRTASAAPVIANMPHRANGSKITAHQQTPKWMPKDTAIAGKEKTAAAPQIPAPPKTTAEGMGEGASPKTEAAPREQTTAPEGAARPSSSAVKTADPQGRTSAPPVAAMPRSARSAQQTTVPGTKTPQPATEKAAPAPAAPAQNPAAKPSAPPVDIQKTTETPFPAAPKVMLPKPAAQPAEPTKKPTKPLKWEQSNTAPASAGTKSAPGKPAETENKSVYKVGDKGWKVKQAQQYLQQLGFNPGTPDGQFTKSTRKAIRKFQGKYNLKVTGNLDNATYEELKWQIGSKEYGGNMESLKILKTAARFRGVPYVWGGTTPKGFDCSGYVQYVFAQNGIHLTRTADTQALEGKHVAKKDLKPGDLVFFTTYASGASHDGIYAGNGKFWNATSSRGVMLCDLNDSYWGPRYYTARRILRSNSRSR